MALRLGQMSEQAAKETCQGRVSCQVVHIESPFDKILPDTDTLLKIRRNRNPPWASAFL